MSTGNRNFINLYFFFQAEDGIRDCLLSRGLGDVYKRQLRRRYHADPLLTGASFVVYICVPIANYTVASSLAAQDQPTHHTHMMVESRPLYLLLRLILAPLRLRRRYHADPLLTGTSNVVYICVPNANYTVASSFFNRHQPTHHTI